MINTQYLDNLIKESGKTKSFLASKLDMSRQNFSNKINGRTAFSADEFMKLMSEINVTLPIEVQTIING